MEIVQRICPKCQGIMGKIDPASIEPKSKKSKSEYWETGTNGTSGTAISTSFRTGLHDAAPRPSEAAQASDEASADNAFPKTTPLIIGIPYKCPKCGHIMSFRS